MDTPRCWCGGLVARLDPTTCMDSVHHDPTATGYPDRITTLYVAGPMSGFDDCNYPAFNDVADQLRRAGYTVRNPAEEGTGAHYVDLLRADLRLLLECHAVAVLEGWWESVGARNEVTVAGVLQMPVRPWREWVARALDSTPPTGY